MRRRTALILAMAPFLALAPTSAPAQQPGAPPPEPGPAPADRPAPPPPPGPAREPLQRDAWYIGVGLGWGDGRLVDASGASTFGELLRGYGPVNLSLSFKVGATLGPKLLLGLDVASVRAAGSAGPFDAAVQVNAYRAMLTFFPWRRGLFVRGGAGFADLVLDTSAGSTHHGGFDLAAGAGYAFWLGRSFNLTVNLDASAQWYGGGGTAGLAGGVSTSPPPPGWSPRRSQVVDVYLGFEWH
ncbi:MAG TPA: hypothetical protein VFI16_06700 [Anaeromyxobacteraceae bacterium]|nr:hypothetical protein [Anaeromyxobacteraceae bacterium]